MYTVIVQASFPAVHRLQLSDATWEPMHGHDWGVRVYFCRPELDESGMVIDFHEAQRHLEGVLAPLQYADLNRIEAFRDRNPTAEVVARYVFDELRSRSIGTVSRVEITEAPGCVAVYETPPFKAPPGT